MSRRKLFGGFYFGFLGSWSLGSWAANAHALALQPFHHQLGAGVSLVGEFAGLGDEGSELRLDFLRFLEGVFLAGFHLAEIASFAD